MSEKETSITQLRENLAKYLDETRRGPVRIMRHSETAAYLVSAAEFEGLVEKLEDLLDIVEATQALKEFAENPDLAVDAEEVYKKLGL
ncbi:MAG: type II toxin-antitoxin system Phd/YefM family antitoxin [Anaerolineales bacterium]|nr:type II toxin-antitoxin system Phd/YefM family antitoxin [Anaerolineales bacterium]